MISVGCCGQFMIIVNKKFSAAFARLFYECATIVLNITDK